MEPGVAASANGAADEPQEMMYNAWEASGTERIALARAALEISPLCADAYISMGGADEATAYIADNGAAWRAVPGAIEWLAAQTSRLKPRQIGRKSR